MKYDMTGSETDTGKQYTVVISPPQNQHILPRFSRISCALLAQANVGQSQ